MHFPVVSFVIDWKLLVLLDCDELCTTLMHHFYAPLINVQVVFQTFKLAVMAKVRGILFLIVGNCDEHMHHVDLSNENYLSDCF